MDWSGRGYECNNQYGGGGEEDEEEEEEEDDFDEEDDEEEEEDDDGDDDDDEEDELGDEGAAENATKPPISKDRRKYQLLCERMAALDQDSEMLVYRINQVNKLIKTGLQERRFLMAQLDKRGDSFRTLPVILPFQAEAEVKKKEGTSSSSGGGGGLGPEKRGQKRTRDKDPMLPKRPQNPFFQFCKEQRGAVAAEALERDGVHLSKKELTKLLASRWNLLTLEQKQVYNTRFVEERDGYNLQMEAYRRRKLPEAALQD